MVARKNWRGARNAKPEAPRTPMARFLGEPGPSAKGVPRFDAGQTDQDNQSPSVVCLLAAETMSGLAAGHFEADRIRRYLDVAEFTADSESVYDRDQFVDRTEIVAAIGIGVAWRTCRL